MAQAQCDYDFGVNLHGPHVTRCTRRHNSPSYAECVFVQWWMSTSTSIWISTGPELKSAGQLARN
eukprot:1453088-Pyramimonas_sp.AAC.1